MSKDGAPIRRVGARKNQLNLLGVVRLVPRQNGQRLANLLPPGVGIDGALGALKPIERGRYLQQPRTNIQELAIEDFGSVERNGHGSVS